MRYELPPGLPPEEERAILAALEKYFETGRVRPSAWALAGRAEALGLGALQVRFQSAHPWNERQAFTRRALDPRGGRGDRK